MEMGNWVLREEVEGDLPRRVDVGSGDGVMRYLPVSDGIERSLEAVTVLEGVVAAFSYGVRHKPVACRIPRQDCENHGCMNKRVGFCMLAFAMDKADEMGLTEVPI